MFSSSALAPAAAALGNRWRIAVAAVATPPTPEEETMRAFRTLILVAATIAAFAVAVPTASASTVHVFHSTKDCSHYTGANPSYCTITVSNVAAIPAGTKVWYTGPLLNSSSFVASDTILKAGTGNTATGYCIDDNRTGLGTCAFWKGTGKLSGFHAIVTVTVDAAGLYHWDGKYWINGK